MLGAMLAVALGGATLPVPVIDHAKAIEVRPVSREVVMCASADALPLVRLLMQQDPNSLVTDRAMTAGGCTQTFSTDPMQADFQEDVDWMGVVDPPKMLRGTLRVVRVRYSVWTGPDEPQDAYEYIAASDLTVSKDDDADAAAKWCKRNHVPQRQCYQGTGGALPPNGMLDDE